MPEPDQPPPAEPAVPDPYGGRPLTARQLRAERALGMWIAPILRSSGSAILLGIVLAIAWVGSGVTPALILTAAIEVGVLVWLVYSIVQAVRSRRDS